MTGEEGVEEEPERDRRSWLSRAWKRFGRSSRVQALLGSGAAAYLRFVGATNRLTYEGAFDYEAFDVRTPLIITMWHGQHFLLPIVRRRDHRIYALISRHRDGEINAIAARKLGVETIRGSAAREPGRVMGSGAVSGYLRMRAVLSEGASVSMTADLSRTVARRAGIGVVHLARASGVPIATAAIATSRRLGIRSWDRASLNLPFGRMALVIGAFIDVPPDADDALMEEKRLAVENELNRITDRAYAIVDRRNA